MVAIGFLKTYRDYILIAFLVAAITGGNYILSGGAKSNWVEASDYGFTMLHPRGVNIWVTGLDDDNVFDPYGTIHANRRAGMIGFNDADKEFAVTWLTFEEEPSLDEVLEVYYHSVEVNAIRRDREFQLELGALTSGGVNGHDALYQINLIELAMPDLDEPLYGKGAAVAWSCDETDVSYVAYILIWNIGEIPSQSDSQIMSSLHWYLDTIKCH
jgi:hypothetical protein